MHDNHDDEHDLDGVYQFPKPKPRRKKANKGLRRTPLRRVRRGGKRSYTDGQRKRRIAQNREYSHVSRPTYLLNLAREQGRLKTNLDELPGRTPRDKLLKLPVEANPRCEVGLEVTKCGGRKPATTVHHTKGRGAYLNDQETFIGVCWPCHSYIEKHRKWARENGYIVSRNDKVLTEDDF